MFILRRVEFGGCGACCSAWAGGWFAGVQVVPVDDGVEAQGEGALGLPAPEGAQGEHDYVALAEGLVDGQAAADEVFASG